MEKQRERNIIAKAYAVVLLAVYPLYAGEGGYASLSAAKSIVFWGMTAVCVLLFILFTADSFPLSMRIAAAEKRADRLLLYLMMAVMLALLLAMITSTDPLKSAVSERGPLFHAAYFAIFLVFAVSGSWDWIYSTAASLAVSLNAFIIALQLSGHNPLNLYPAELTYFDAHKKYSGIYLGTMGNADILCVWLILAMAICLGAVILAPGGMQRAVAAAGCFAASFSGLAAGTAGFMIACPALIVLTAVLLLSDTHALLKWLSGCALVCAGTMSGRTLRCFAEGECISAKALALSALFLASGILGMTLAAKTRRREFNKRVWFLGWLALIVLCVSAGLFGIYRGSFSEGLLHELHEILHGRIRDDFGSKRILIWRKCLDAFAQRPVFGWGEPFVTAVRILFETTTEAGYILRTVVGDAHNILLSWLVHNGVIGTAAAIALVAVILYRAIRYGAEISRLCTAAMLAYLLIECTCLGGYFTDPIFWMLGGLALANAPQRKEIQQNGKGPKPQ